MLDKIDRKLLCLLQQDCTLSLQALADAVNLTTTPCWKRLKRLEDDGILLGFWRMAGEYDYLMRVQVADMKRYDDFYKRLVNSVPGLSDVTSSFAMEQIKYTTSLPIE
ncbi:Lrp/AsnC family transcriptional regulator [Salmonella enterica]|uniref:Lrp/AsnC family transcriptional regulator n=1 Tax=Salmonella enterica TaxID=28901 RepID=A0A5T3SN07_SALER|nr:Lrp/AsnC family transcriptional regulator [Salmonella enterica]ELB7468069.1 Lrp/AsnC family transcriptional regulator [Salmonella enterica]